jgi:glyoxylase-like metal-dependent hydrolase (beta-lactamase superfamily II)
LPVNLHPIVGMSVKVTAIGSHTLRITRYGFVNCYLVREHGADAASDSFTLVDTGLKGTEDAILVAAAKVGAPIRRILLTHAHVDHVGSVDALMHRLPGAELAACDRSLPLLRKPADKSLRPGEPRKSFAGGLPGIDSAVTHIVAEGELYGSLRCIATPGHIPGHMSFLDERDGTLFAGDELTAVGRLAVCGWTPWYFPLPSWVMWSKPLALASARSLLDYPIERFACGHGKVREGGLTLLREAVANAAR